MTNQTKVYCGTLDVDVATGPDGVLTLQTLLPFSNIVHDGVFGDFEICMVLARQFQRQVLLVCQIYTWSSATVALLIGHARVAGPFNAAIRGHTDQFIFKFRRPLR